MQTLTIEYYFLLPDKTALAFPVTLNMETLELVRNVSFDLPDWTVLQFHRCPNCPSSFSQNSHCPVAAALAGIVTKFEPLLSYEFVAVKVISDEREIRQETTVQRAVASYMGLIMATCGCPNTLFLRPMARFHLPLANEDETIYRAFSMYALAQYFVRKKGLDADDSFQLLQEYYLGLQTVNKSLLDRLRSASHSDSSLNALLNLDVYARAMPYVIEDSLEEMKYIFAPYLKL